MKFDILTVFPEIFENYFEYSLLEKAQKKGVIGIKAHNLRDFTDSKQKQVDDKPFGGGRGMVLQVEPIAKAIKKIKENSKKSKIIMLSPRGKKFDQKMATKFSKLDQLILISGRYEGVDERVVKYIADEEISIGDYVLMSGDVAAIAIVEATARLIDGVIGKPELVKTRITKQGGFIEYPQYTRPEEVKIDGRVRKAPKVLMSGNHKEIDAWRQKNSKIIE